MFKSMGREFGNEDTDEMETNVTIAFLKERRREICFSAVFAGIFAAVSYLYNIRRDAVEYAFLLSAVWLLLSGAADYLKYVRKHRSLTEAEKNLASGIEGVPEADTLLEKDYQRILSRLYEMKIEAESTGRIVRQEMMDYYGMWVHQIKTPISAMHVLIQTLEGMQAAAYDSEEFEDILNLNGAGHYLKGMKLELFKIEQYVEMALTYLRMEDMSSDLSFKLCSLDLMIRQAVRKYSQMFILKKIKLEYGPVEKNVLTDEKWLVFVLEQILSNALKYTKNSGECGRISIYMEDSVSVKQENNMNHPEKTESCLVIEDNGIGISPEDLPRVFEKGFTGYNGRTDKKSTGIGLYLCKSVMDKLRHEIWIESEVGKGTRVYLSLTRKAMQHE